MRRPRKASAIEPGIEYGEGERSHAQYFDRTDVVERFHHRQRHACNDSRPRQRERHEEELPRAACAEHPSRLDDGAALHFEKQAAGEIHIGVEHDPHDKHGAADRSDVGKPVLRRSGYAQHIAKERLDRPGEAQKLDEAIGRYVGGDCQRQDQEPVHEGPAGKIVPADQPGRADADGCRRRADPCHQHQRDGERAGQHIDCQVPPDAFDISGGQHEQRNHGDNGKQRDEDRSRQQRLVADGSPAGRARLLPPSVDAGALDGAGLVIAPAYGRAGALRQGTRSVRQHALVGKRTSRACLRPASS